MKTICTYLIAALLVSIALASLAAANPAVKWKSTRNRDAGGENFFTSPIKSASILPIYRTDKKTAEKIRAFIQAGTPELEQLRLISSLKGKQRDEILKSYEKARSDLQPLMNEFNEIRREMNASLIDKMLSNEEPQMESKMKQKDFELLLKARAAIQNLRSKRLSNWEEMQRKLNVQQIDELEKLKSGELPAELKAD